MRVLVTGANGLIGSHLVEKLLQRGDEVVCLLRKDPAHTWLKGLPIRVVKGDLTSAESLIPAVEGVETVFHLAARTRGRGFERDNAQGTANLAAAMTKTGPQPARLIFLSSLAAHGPSRPGRPLVETDPARPVSAYGRSKLASEATALGLADQTPVFIFRLCSVYGPRDTNFVVPFKWLKRGLCLRIGPGQELSLIHVADVVQALLLAAGAGPERAGLYHLSDGRIYLQEDFLGLAAELMGVRLRLFPGPRAVVACAAAASECAGWLTGRPTIFGWDKFREMTEPGWAVEGRKVQEELGFSPGRELRDGLAETISWYLEHQWL